MAIGNVIQRGGIAYVYDEKNKQIFTIMVGSGPNNAVVGYTSSQVNVKRGYFIYSYDSHGKQTGTRSAK